MALSQESQGSSMDLETKARLIAVGTVRLEEPRQSGPASTAGPGAGGQSIFFQSGPHLVRLSVTEGSLLRLESRPDGAAIMETGREVVRGNLVQPLLHCPGQAYIPVSERCIYDCKFCAVPRLKGSVKSLGRVLQMVEDAAKTGGMKAISLTSGVEISPELEGERVAEMVRQLSRFGVPIGVSICPYPGVNRRLRDAGAAEVKYNLECADRDLFRLVCPGISYQEIMDALVEAVDVFGRNHVFSNIIIGLGESDETLRRTVDDLTEKGIIPVLRAVYPHPLRAGVAVMERPTAARLLDLARYLKAALERSGLDGGAALTGCYRCTGCDLTPGRDL